MRRVVAATQNAAKVERLSDLIGDLAAVAPLPPDVSLEPPADQESGDLFTEIAQAKARTWSRALGTDDLVVASDGGLLIPALGDVWDPLRTRRFAGGGRSNRERADALLALAAGLEGEQRRVVWREAMAVARSGVVLATWEADGPPGLLARDYDPAWLDASDGFWMPVLWLCPEYGGRRLANLTAVERAARIDHWARLGAGLRRFLVGLPPAADR